MKTTSNSIQSTPDSKHLACDINNLIFQMSSEMAGCRGEDLCEIIDRAVHTFGRLHHAVAGWFRLLDNGELVALCQPLHALPVPASFFKEGLRSLPWSLAQVEAGKSAILECEDRHSGTSSDYDFLKTSHIRSLAILPGRLCDLGRTVLLLVSSENAARWSKDLVEQGMQLSNLLTNAEQLRLAQREARACHQSFDQLFDSVSCPMALLDQVGGFVSMNAAFAQALGYKHDEIKQMRYFDIVEPKGRHRAATSLKLSTSNRTSKIHDEQTLIRKDLTRLSTEITLTPLDEPGLGEAHSVLTIEDLTVTDRDKNELRKRELEIKALASQLIRSQECERKRLSRELHDDIGQRLSLAASGVALLASQQNGTPSSGRLDSIRDELDSLCSDLHNMSHNLHSYKLQHLGLKPAMKDLCRQFQNSDFQVDLHIDDFEGPGSADVALCLYRVAQEALNNASRHAHSNTAAVVLTRLEEMFYMTIQDSGVGFEEGKVLQGLGLISMSERLKLLGGEFRVHSTPGRGTEIWVAVPAYASASVTA